jgi:flagellar hook-associated protein 2
MTTNVASTINLTSLGLGDGLNDSSIISQLVAIESAPLTGMETQAATISSASSTLAAFSSDMTTLQKAANQLSDPSQFNVQAASSTSPSVVATTSTGALSGTHSIDVTQVASAQTTYSSPQSSSTNALGLAGTLGITIGGTSYSVNVSSTDSLANIASDISSSGAPVTASVVYDGSQYRLDVQGTYTGSANAFTFDESGFSLGLSTPANTYQAATNTEATIDGIAVSSSTAQISGAIPGVSIAVTGPTNGSATLTVSASSSTLATSLQSFVTAYNNVVSAGHTDTGYGSTTASNALLASDPGIRSCLNQLSSLVAGSVAGSDSTLTTLGSLGLTLNSDGSLSLNTSTLSQSVQTDSSGVEKLLISSVSSGFTGIMGTIATTIGTLATAPNAVLLSESQYFQTQSTGIKTQETAMQARIAMYQTQLQAEFSNADETVNNERSLFTDVGGTGTFM